MIYVFEGNRNLFRKKVKEICENSCDQCKKVYFSFSFNEVKDDFFSSLNFQESLFSEIYCYSFFQSFPLLFEKKFFEEAFSSHHFFFFFEEKLSEEKKDFLKKKNIPFSFLGMQKKKKKEYSYNIFSLADAIGMRDRKKAWLLFHEARTHGISPEEIHRIFFWIVKNMIIISFGEGKNMKSFVRNKSLSFSKKYSPSELLSLIKKLEQIFHERKKNISLSEEIERLLLSL